MSEAVHPMRLGLPDLGVGVGLRIPHYEHIFETRPRVDFFEIISENFMVAGGRPIQNLERALETYRLVNHGVSLSIGGPEPLDRDYLVKLKALLKKTGSPWVSDHLCWTGAHGANLHDLLPLPYTDEAVQHVAARVREVQDFLETRFVLENVSSYLTYTASAMTEHAFLSAVVEEADCGILLDVNNIYVSSFNHGFDPNEYVDAVPARRVVQYHLAGHTHRGKYILDTHSAPVIDPVWELYRRACRRTGPVSTLVEWDDDIPSFEALVAEAEKARAIRNEVAEVPAPLDEVQGFLAAVFRREDPVLGDAALSAACAAHVAGNDRLTPAEQVDIYRRQFWMRHVDSLAEDYIALQHVLGDEAFEAFCHAYLDRHPPHVPSLRNLGADIPAFAESFAGFPPALRDLAVDMARYENAFIEIFDGPEPPPLDADKLRGLAPSAWETARIVLHPLLVRMTVRYPVHKIRFAVKAEEKPELSAHPRYAEPMRLALFSAHPRYPEPMRLALFRKDLTIHYEELAPEAATLLDRLAEGVPLVPACAAAALGASAERAAELEALVGVWFQQWTAWGIIVDVVPAR